MNNKFKNAFENITPDIYMETRLLAKIEDYPDKAKARPVFRRLGAAVLALALFCGAFAGFNTYQSSNEKSNNFQITSNHSRIKANDFQLIAYAAESDREFEINDTDVTLPGWRIISLPRLIIYLGNDDSMAAATMLTFKVKADGLESVTFKAENFFEFGPLEGDVRDTTAEATFKDNDHDGEIGNIFLSPFKLHIGSEIKKYSDIPPDDIYITVKFKSGEKVQKHLIATFDDDGWLQLKYAK